MSCSICSYSREFYFLGLHDLVDLSALKVRTILSILYIGKYVD